MDKFAFAPVIPLIFGAAAVLFACAGGTDSAAQDPAATFGSGGTGGTCLPTSAMRMGVRSLLPGCSATYGGSANVVEGSLTVPILGTKIAIDLGSSGLVGSAGGTKTGNAATVNVNGFIGGNSGTATAVGLDGQTVAESALKGLDIGIAGLSVTANVVGSQALASCGSVATGSSTITGLKIAGQSITVTGAANQTVSVGLLTVVINEQLPTANGIQVNALHVSALGILDVTVGGALASVICSCLPPTDSGTGVGVGVGVGVGSSSGAINIGVDAGVAVNDGGIGVGVGVGVGVDLDAGGIGIDLDAGVGIGVGVGIGASSGGIVVDAGVSSSSGGLSSGGVVIIGGGSSTSSSAGGITISLDAGITLPGSSSSSSSGSAATDAGGSPAEAPITTLPSTSSSSGGEVNTNVNAGLDASTDSTPGTLGSACDPTNPCATGYSCSTTLK